jgi:hypothetical protein
MEGGVTVGRSEHALVESKGEPAPRPSERADLVSPRSCRP